MKKILLILSIFFCFTVLADDKIDCNQGDQNRPEQNAPIKDPVAGAASKGQVSYDPNEIIGPSGYDSVRWVSINDVLHYTIFFENDPDFATAAAQRVDVRFDFLNKLWMNGFGIGGYSFANMSFPVDKPSNAYQERIDLKESKGYFVDVIAGLDVVRQQGFWTFTTIDPETGYAPMQAELGLLPINDSTHVGEGAVTFQLKPYSELKTGDTISIQASILFDMNDTIPTNRWCNKIDAGMPESRVSAQPHPSLEGVYNLTFTGQDDRGGSGVRHLLLYLANHNGIYEEIDTVAVDTVLAFPTEPGRQYKLYSIAVDNTGNREPLKTEPDVVLNFNLAPTDIILSNSTFHDDLEAGGYIGQLTTIDTEDVNHFTYALAEGDGAVHNDLFQITDDQLQLKRSLKCAMDSVYQVRISTTDEGGMSFEKAFVLRMQYVLEHPETDTLTINLCQGEAFEYRGKVYDQAGIFYDRRENDYMCDSVTVLHINILPYPEAPTVTVEGTCTLVSSALEGNQWYRDDGIAIDGACEQRFTPTEDGVYYVCTSNGSCMSPPSLSYRVQMDDHLTLSWDLSKGWNWVSSSLKSRDMQDANTFLALIADYVEVFTDGIQSLSQTDGTLSGNLQNISPRVGYWLKVTEDLQHTQSGLACRPEENAITLVNGWNNIGYLPVGENPIDKALVNLTPSPNDVMKSFDKFSVYEDGQWHGTLTHLRPGEGYLYLSGRETAFTYPVTRVFELEPQNSKQVRLSESIDVLWPVNAHAYQDNMTMVAKLVDSNTHEVPPGVYTIGAFVGDDCRGIGKWIDDRLYLLIHGTDGMLDEIEFKGYNHATGETVPLVNVLTFGNLALGSIHQPVELQLQKASGIDETFSGNLSYSIYPVPVLNRLYVNGDVDSITRIKVLGINGKLFLDTPYHDGIDVSDLDAGTYIACLATSHGFVYKKFIKAP